MTAGKMDQAHRPTGPIDQSPDRRTTVLADDQVSLPVADPPAGLDDRRAAMDQHWRSDVARCPFGCLAAPLSERPACAQLGRQRPAQPALAAEIQCLINRFVADVPFRTVGILRAQPGADLLRTPGVLQLV